MYCTTSHHVIRKFGLDVDTLGPLLCALLKGVALIIRLERHGWDAYNRQDYYAAYILFLEYT